MFEYDHDFYVTNLELNDNEAVNFHKKRATCKNYIKESKYDMNIGTLLLNSFCANEVIFQIQMLVYNISDVQSGIFFKKYKLNLETKDKIYIF